MEFQQKFRIEAPRRTSFDSNDRAWIKLAYLSVMFMFANPIYGGILGPLTIMLSVGINNRGVEIESREALNFGISMTLTALALAITTKIATLFYSGDIKSYGIILLGFYVFGSIVVAWRNTTKLKPFRHPLIIRFIKEPQRRNAHSM